MWGRGMIFVEQLVYGIDPAGESSSRALLGLSPGLGKEVAFEIQRFCDGWGQAPALGLQRPALLSFPLVSTMPSQRGRLFAVIQVGLGSRSTFQAAVLSDADYAEFEYNPFTLLEVGIFSQEWQPGSPLPLRQISVDKLAGIPTAKDTVTVDDVGVVDEALLKLLGEGSLKLPIEQAVGQSDRILSLIISLLPDSIRKNLRFASFTTGDSNNYTLAARESEGSSCAGWKRWFMAQTSVAHDGANAAYIRAVRDALKSGDMGELEKNAWDDVVLGGAAESVAVRDVIAPDRGMRDDPYRPAIKPKPTTQVHPAARRNAIGPLQDREPVERTPRVRKLARPRLVRQQLRISEVGKRRLPVPIAMTVVFVAAAMAGYLWLSHGGQDGGFGWAVLKSKVTSEYSPRAATLLEVVNVGKIYNRQVKKVARSGLGGLVDSGPRDRNEVLTVLQVEAAAPLLEQVDLFLKLADDGIQQGNRPDRETRRLESLSGQGDMLLQEIDRLELAWLSLSTGLNWQDLGNMSDQEVRARRDSLLTCSAQVMAEAGRELGTSRVRGRLGSAKRQVDGMQTLLTRFQQEQWSQRWEDQLYKAAEQISPSAAGMTRAYRNAAFVIVRLKKAERLTAHRDLPYAVDFENTSWPCTEVQDVLPSLRKQMRKFAVGEAPLLLSGISSLYTHLGKPDDLAEEMRIYPTALEKLESNPAFIFDPGAYTDYLDRIRFEAAGSLLDLGADPDIIPDAYFIGGDRKADLAFREAQRRPEDPRSWAAQAAGDGPAFYVSWSKKQAGLARDAVLVRQRVLDQDYRDCVGLSETLRRHAAAGEDWTETWLVLWKQATDSSLGFAGEVDAGRLTADRQARLQTFLGELEQERSLPLTAVTIRFAQAILSEPTEVLLKFRIEPGGRILVSPPILIGPASPAGTGWVGTGNLGWNPPVGPRSSFKAEVLDAVTGESLLKVDWDSLVEGMGPGLMTRPREGDSGSVKFRLDPAWWGGLSFSILE
ncbi:MAG: hypothetical protein KOO60_00630 [Gemmatimonadales bacterium]|nr:hypothetical protein [Gemmatimonadales bacterium]